MVIAGGFNLTGVLYLLTVNLPPLVDVSVMVPDMAGVLDFPCGADYA
jgi:hypothetical protein